jgi:hypothetical protein
VRSLVALRALPCVSMRCGEPPARRSQREDLMLNERQTLTILGWTLGTVCIGTLVLSALSLR